MNRLIFSAFQRTFGLFEKKGLPQLRQPLWYILFYFTDFVKSHVLRLS